MAEKKKSVEKKKTRAKPKKEAPETKKVEKVQEQKADVKEEVKEKKVEEKTEEKPKKTKKEEKVDIVAENVYTIPLREVYRRQPKYKRTNKAIVLLVKYIARHMKASEVKLDNGLNQHIWARGDCKPPRKVQVKAVKDSKGRVTVSLLK